MNKIKCTKPKTIPKDFKATNSTCYGAHYMHPKYIVRENTCKCPKCCREKLI